MQDMEQYKKKVKENIEELINSNALEEAEKAILEYEEIVKNDIDMVSMKAIIFIMKNEFEKARRLLIKSLNKYGEIFDLLFNLAYIYELNSNYDKAYYYYVKASEKSSDMEMKNNINDILISLKNNHNVGKKIDKKRVLVIAQIFPPMGGSGVQRTLKFVKYLREFNWEPIVVTVGNTVFNYLKDVTLEKEIPQNLEVVRFDEKLNFSGDEATNLLNEYEKLVNNDEIMSQYKDIINNLSKNNNGEKLLKAFFVPDYSSFWAMDVIDKIDEFVDFNSIDIIYSTSGPYSDHIVGYFLKDRFNKPWVCDFRDEWTNNPYANFDKNNITYKIIRSMEVNILNKCNMLVTISPLAKENYINDLDVPENKITIITNGYDEEDFSNITINTEKRDKFRITHNGLLYMIRTPETFFQAIKNLVDKKYIDKNKFEAIFSYTDNKDRWQKYLKENNIDDIVTFKNYMSHNDSINLSLNSDILLLIVGSGEKNKGVYTGKVFEYLRMGRPILALSPSGSVVEQLLHSTRSGESFEFEDIDGISNYIYKNYKEWENGVKCYQNSNQLITKYERKNLTGSLVKEFEKIHNLDSKVKEIENLLNSNCELTDNSIEAILKEALTYCNDDYRLLSILAKYYLKKERFYESYKFNNMAINSTNSTFKKNAAMKSNQKILSNKNINEFKRRCRQEMILIGDTMNEGIVNLIKKVGNIKKVISISQIGENMTLESISNNKDYDYIIILENDNNKVLLIKEKLKLINVNENKIFDFYSYPYPYFIEGFENKLDNFLKESRIDILVSGLSYAEIGIECKRISYPSYNFALSGQDIFYDYHLCKFLLGFENLKSNIRYTLINFGYYAFDYDLSRAEQCTRIHRYYNDIGETHNYNNILHLKICDVFYKMHDYKNDYKMFHNYKLNTTLNLNNAVQEDKVAEKQANMNYPETVRENKKIFGDYLQMLHENNITPIIVVLPTSKYYRRFYSNNYQKNKFYKIMNEFRGKYKFHIFDFFDSDMFKDEDFFDYSHLNKFGSKKFTDMLMKELEKVLFLGK